MDYPKSIPGVGLAGGRFTDGDPANGILPSLDPAAWANAVTDEILNAIRGAGLEPNETNVDQLAQALAKKAAIDSPEFFGVPVAPTRPQFNNDTSLATTAFVQRAIGNWRGFAANTVGGTFTLVAADAGKTIVLSGASVTGTLVLPKIGTVPDGAGWLIKCEAVTSNWSIATHADDGANMVVGQAVASVPIRRGDYAIITRGGGSWRVHGSVCLPYSDSFANQLTAIGYQRLPSGLIMQWGQAAAAATAGQPTTITLPIANPVATRSITITRTGGTAGVDFNTFTISDITTTNFVVRAQVSGSPTFFWMAIGH